MSESPPGRLLIVVLLLGLAGLCLVSTMWLTGFELFVPALRKGST